MYGLSEDDLQAIDFIIDSHSKEFDAVIKAKEKAEIDAWVDSVAYEGAGG